MLFINVINVLKYFNVTCLLIFTPPIGRSITLGHCRKILRGCTISNNPKITQVLFITQHLFLNIFEDTVGTCLYLNDLFFRLWVKSRTWRWLLARTQWARICVKRKLKDLHLSPQNLLKCSWQDLQKSRHCLFRYFIRIYLRPVSLVFHTIVMWDWSQKYY